MSQLGTSIYLSPGYLFAKLDVVRYLSKTNNLRIISLVIAFRAVPASVEEDLTITVKEWL